MCTLKEWLNKNKTEMAKERILEYKKGRKNLGKAKG